jgi:hypothetical protein
VVVAKRVVAAVVMASRGIVVVVTPLVCLLVAAAIVGSTPTADIGAPGKERVTCTTGKLPSMCLGSQAQPYGQALTDNTRAVLQRGLNA